MNTKRRPEYPKMRGIEAFLSSANLAPESSQEIASASPPPVSKSQISPDSPPRAIALEQIRLPQQQPRRHFDPEKMAQLEQSVRQHGILEPVLVRPLPLSSSQKTAGPDEMGEANPLAAPPSLPQPCYELVAGERRYRAAQRVGLTEIPVVIHDFNDEEAWQVALMENLQRDDLNPVEETEGLLELLSLNQGLSKAEAIALLNQVANAKKRGQPLTDNVVRQMAGIEALFAATSGITPESFRSHRLPLLNLPADVLAALRTNQISYTKAKAIARIPDLEARQAFLEEAIAQDLSLNQIKARLAEILPPKKHPPALKQRFQTAFHQLQQSDRWTHPKYQKRLKKILAQIEAVLSDE
jgi:ParB family chromosome partitioning protein